MTSSEARWSGAGTDPKARWVPPAPRGAASLTRFIPREELHGFAAWQPHAFGQPGADGFLPMQHAATKGAASAAADVAQAHGAIQPVDQVKLADVSEPDPKAAADAASALQQDPADALVDPAAQEAALQQARQAGYQDGYRDGLVALDSFKESFAQQMTGQIGQLLQSFDAAFGALEQRMAKRVAEVATELARQVVRCELQQRPALVAEVAQQAIAALLVGARHITVQLHPEDLPLVQAGCADVMQARGARLVAQRDIERGGCLIEADLGQIDARMATRWQQATKALGCDLPWQDEPGQKGADMARTDEPSAQAQREAEPKVIAPAQAKVDRPGPSTPDQAPAEPPDPHDLDLTDDLPDEHGGGDGDGDRGPGQQP